MIEIYTDGASRGNPGPGGWGAILMSEERVVEIGGRETHATNNRMELTACIRSLEFTISNFQFSNIQVYTDSEYVAKGMTDWIHEWKRKNWKTAGRKPVLNQDLWKELYVLAHTKDIKWEHVSGHSGDKFNDRCDEIATAFADNQHPDLYHGPRAEYK